MSFGLYKNFSDPKPTFSRFLRMNHTLTMVELRSHLYKEELSAVLIVKRETLTWITRISLTLLVSCCSFSRASFFSFFFNCFDASVAILISWSLKSCAKARFWHSSSYFKSACFWSGSNSLPLFCVSLYASNLPYKNSKTKLKWWGCLRFILVLTRVVQKVIEVFFNKNQQHEKSR